MLKVGYLTILVAAQQMMDDPISPIDKLKTCKSGFNIKNIGTGLFMTTQESVRTDDENLCL